MKCAACRGPVGASDYRAELGGEYSDLCLACWGKVVRGGRTPQQTMEALLMYAGDDSVGGPDDPLDHEDYRDLELLGLWPETE